jgi:hypothetical protein
MTTATCDLWVLEQEASRHFPSQRVRLITRDYLELRVGGKYDVFTPHVNCNVRLVASKDGKKRHKWRNALVQSKFKLALYGPVIVVPVWVLRQNGL